MFIVRNLWRLYGGWYDGNPSHLKPAPDRLVGVELAEIAGGAGKLASRAATAAARGDHALACHLAEWSWLAKPEDREVNRIREAVYRDRSDLETSLMAKSIFLAAARDSED